MPDLFYGRFYLTYKIIPRTRKGPNHGTAHPLRARLATRGWSYKPHEDRENKRNIYLKFN